MGLNVDDRRRYNEEGIVVLQTDIFLNPNYKWAHNNLGVLYDRLYDLIKPEKEESVGPLFHVTPEPEQAIAVMEASKEAYRRVLVVDDEQIYAHFNLGLGAIKLKQFSRAIDSLNRALITDPSRYDIYKYLSSCYVQTKEYKRALRATEKYLEKELLVQVMKKRPKSQDRSNYEQIMQSLREGDYAKAVTQARLIMQWENFDIYQQYLTIAKDISDNDDVENSDIALTAIEMAEKVIATPRPEYYLYYAKIYERLNKLDSAAKCVEDYLRVRPDDDEIRQSLMLLYVKLNDFPHAQKTMAVLVEKDPNNWTNLVTYARLLSGVNTPWSQIFPYVERAIQNGGDEARRAIAEDQPGNLILPYVKQDPRMLELLGPAFLPASSTQPSVELQPVPGIDASNQPVPSDESAIPTPQSGDSESAPIPQSASQ